MFLEAPYLEQALPQGLAKTGKELGFHALSNPVSLAFF